MDRARKNPLYYSKKVTKKTTMPKTKRVVKNVSLFTRQRRERVEEATESAVAVKGLMELERHRNLLLHGRGRVFCCKVAMRSPVPVWSGAMTILPNYRAKTRWDNVTPMPDLSPFLLGPVEHGNPEVPPIKSMENWWQWSKVFADEYDEENDRVLPLFQQRLVDRAQKEGSRHKQRGVAPLFAIHYVPEADETRRFPYIESRYFYCTQYEKLTRHSNDLTLLRLWIHQGYSVVIAGYDGFDYGCDVAPDKMADLLYERYLDPTRPFGHEMVLVALVALRHTEDYPWNRYYELHKALYTRD